MPFRPLHALIGILLWCAGCSAPVYYVQPREWRSPAVMDSVIAWQRSALQGHVIFLDPGHGGEDRANRGPGGDAIEADVNLKVGLALRTLLVRAGATVVMSREKDTSITLADRAPLATRSGAELFISLHHNATGTGDDITNYSSVYYHARPGHSAYFPSNHDIARYLERDLSYAMRNAPPPSSPTFDGTLSDFDIYPNSGFAVLRAATMPAVLVEASFFTHPHEERRLALDEFNRIEAWGLFLGLARYFRAGYPRLDFRSDTLVSPPWPPLRIALTGQGPFDPSTIDVRIDQRPVRPAYDSAAMSLIISPDTMLTSGSHTLTAVIGQPGGNSSWPFARTLLVMLPAESSVVTASPPAFPARGEGTVRVVCALFDRNQMPVADGMPIRVTGSGLDTTVRTVQGRGAVYAVLPAGAESSAVRCSAGMLTRTIRLVRGGGYDLWRGGIVRGADDLLPLSGVSVSALGVDGVESAADTTFGDGRFNLLVHRNFLASFLARRDGFTPDTIPAFAAPADSPVAIRLRPVAERRLFGKTYLLDARYGGIERGITDSTGLCGADINLEIVLRAAALLRAAGANPVLVRSSDSTLFESARIRFSSLFSSGMYIRIDAAGAAGRAACTIYPGLTNARFAGCLLRGVRSVAQLDSAGIEPVRDRFHTDVALGTVTLILPSPKTGAYKGGSAVFENFARGVYWGILEAEERK